MFDPKDTQLGEQAEEVPEHEVGCVAVLQKLASLKGSLDADPTNIEAALRYWLALASFAGNDVRSGGYLIEAFRGCALESIAGVIAFGRACRELYEKRGETPRPELFDEALVLALRNRLPELAGWRR